MHFVLGMGEVIQGWDPGLLGMRTNFSSEAVLVVWLTAPLPTPRALPDHGALWPLAVGVEKIWAVSMFDLAV